MSVLNELIVSTETTLGTVQELASAFSVEFEDVQLEDWDSYEDSGCIEYLNMLQKEINKILENL